MSWVSKCGIYLMESDIAGIGTELVKEEGTVEVGFPLKYKHV